jgi:hypothetical protein
MMTRRPLSTDGSGAANPSRDIWYCRGIALIAIGFYLAACAHDSPSVPQAAYSTKIVGRWRGTVGDLKETVTISANGTFLGQLYPTGFIANTLAQGRPGKISGTWKINGKVMTLRITAEKSERIANRTAANTIVAFNDDELVLRSDRGETSSFRRLSDL